MVLAPPPKGQSLSSSNLKIRVKVTDPPNNLHELYLHIRRKHHVSYIYIYIYDIYIYIIYIYIYHIYIYIIYIYIYIYISYIYIIYIYIYHIYIYIIYIYIIYIYISYIYISYIYIYHIYIYILYISYQHCGNHCGSSKTSALAASLTPEDPGLLGGPSEIDPQILQRFTEVDKDRVATCWLVSWF